MGDDRITLGFGHLGTLLDGAQLIPAAVVSRPSTHAAINPFESIGRFDALKTTVSRS